MAEPKKVYKIIDGRRCFKYVGDLQWQFAEEEK